MIADACSFAARMDCVGAPISVGRDYGFSGGLDAAVLDDDGALARVRRNDLEPELHVSRAELFLHVLQLPHRLESDDDGGVLRSGLAQRLSKIEPDRLVIKAGSGDRTRYTPEGLRTPYTKGVE